MSSAAASPDRVNPAHRPPSIGLWDALLAAGGPAAAFELLGRIDRAEDWSAGPSIALPTGSNWDATPAGPEAPWPHHLAEWVDGSAVAPELAAANLQTITGTDVLEVLAGTRLEQLRGWAQQYTTGAVAHLLRPLEPVAAAGGWWCSGLDPLADWAPMGWGCFKPDQPRWDADRNRQRKYEHPISEPARLFWLRVPAGVAQLVADRHGLPLPSAVSADSAGTGGAFWRWWAQTPALPLVITEGAKKAAALLSAGVPAVAAPGIWNPAPRNPATGRPELLAELARQPLKGRPAWVLYDWSDSQQGRDDVARAARRVGELLKAAGALVLVGVCPGPHKGADDHLAAGGTWEQLAAQLCPLTPAPVLPRLRPADQVAPAGQWLGVAAPLPAPEHAQLVVAAAPMGCGKTEAVAAALAPLAADGVPVLMPSHRQALGQAAAERIGVPWCPAPGSDERLQGVAGCWDSWCPNSGLEITGTGWNGGVMVLDEVAQGLEHLLLSTGTALADRRAAVLRTAAEQLPRQRQVIALDAQLPEWAVALLERLTGRRAHLITSDHQPMAGRPLHAPAGFTTPAAAADAFRAKWAELVASGQPFLCWTSAQQAGSKNAPQTLAALHRQRVPDARVLVIDSTTPEAAAAMAANPDQVAAGYDAIYCSPAISSGLSWARWRPAAVIAYAGGRIAPEHAAQALARVRCPEVPAYLFAPEVAPGGALRVGSGATDPAELIHHLQAVGDPLFGVLETAGDPWLQAWAELGAHRNRQRYAYRATIAGLLEREGWQLQAAGSNYCRTTAGQVTDQLEAITTAALEAEEQAILNAELITTLEAIDLSKKRQLEPSERYALQRYRLAERWALGTATPSPELLAADRDGLGDRLRLGWLLTTPEALALVPAHDQARVAALDDNGRPFAPDRLRVALAPRVAALQALGVPQLLARFAAGEAIAANDPAVVALHVNATACRGQLAQAAGVSPGKLATGTLRALLRACGWQLQRAGRIKARGQARDAYTYGAKQVALPAGVDAQALAAVWLEQLKASPAGAKSAPIGNPCRGQKSPTPTPPPPPGGLEQLLLRRAAPIPWPVHAVVCTQQPPRQKHAAHTQHQPLQAA
ncbi:MAG: DUF3854 domain-containing protein [Cyanobacteriota bacterium]|nr:DUF3854 domain-containing protein [Cyanobacteriota bacterium]